MITTPYHNNDAYSSNSDNVIKTRNDNGNMNNIHRYIDNKQTALKHSIQFFFLSNRLRKQTVVIEKIPKTHSKIPAKF